jgi:uncharacterized protein YigA (DUF484 family)
VAGCATQTGSAGHASATARLKLTFHLDHSVGANHDLLERHLERVTLTPNHLELRLRELVESTQAHDSANTSAGRPTASVTTITVPWTSPVPARR